MRDILDVAVTKTKAAFKGFGKSLKKKRKRSIRKRRGEDNGVISGSLSGHENEISTRKRASGTNGNGFDEQRGHSVEDQLFDLAHPYTGILKNDFGIKADGVSFQPCKSIRNQDRYVVEQFVVNGSTWTLTGVFDGKPLSTLVKYNLG